MAEPKCPYFGKCGGCTFQHIDYSTQLEQKKKQLISAIDFNEVSVFSDKDYGYRNRMDFIFHENGLGLREKGQWSKIVDIKECAISDSRINELLTELRSCVGNCDYFDVKKQTGTFKYFVVRVADETSISFVLNEESSKLAEAREKIEKFAEKTKADNIVITYVPKKTDVSISSDYFVIKGRDVLRTKYLGKTFEYSVQGFYQNNHVMAEKMHEYVTSLVKKHDTSKMNLLDLYGGVGTFGIMNSELFKSTLTVESVKECTDSANKNIQSNNAKNTKAMTLDAKNIRKLSLEQPLFVITDPPRSGMDEKTILHLRTVKPKVIIYISCNVEQLAKDIPKFKEYSVKSAALFDLFPQTPHSEAVVELILKD